LPALIKASLRNQIGLFLLIEVGDVVRIAEGVLHQATAFPLVFLPSHW
jgi:hypothetical protein